MKKIYFLVLAMVAILATSALAENRTALVTERWQEKRDGVVVDDVEKTSRIVCETCSSEKILAAKIMRIDLDRKNFQKKVTKMIDGDREALRVLSQKAQTNSTRIDSAEKRLGTLEDLTEKNSSSISDLVSIAKEAKGNFGNLKVAVWILYVILAIGVLSFFIQRYRRKKGAAARGTVP